MSQPRKVRQSPPLDTQQALTPHVTVSAHRPSSARGPGVSGVTSDEYHQVDCETTGEKGKKKRKKKKKKREKGGGGGEGICTPAQKQTGGKEIGVLNRH